MVKKTAATCPGTMSLESIWKAGKERKEANSCPLVIKEVLFPYMLLITAAQQGCRGYGKPQSASLWPRELCFHDRPGSIVNATQSQMGSTWKMESEDRLRRQIPRCGVHVPLKSPKNHSCGFRVNKYRRIIYQGPLVCQILCQVLR